jgi:hypothetical protein
MQKQPKLMRQLLDWRATFWAGLISGVISLVLNMVLTQSQLGTPWVFVRMVASIVMGEAVLPPPASFDLPVFLVGLVVHLALSLIFAAVLTAIIHRWGIVVGFVGGALFGIALYGINFFTLSYFFPWFYSLRNWMIFYSHIAFGALAGGIYELLEVEEFVPVEEGAGHV